MTICLEAQTYTTINFHTTPSEQVKVWRATLSIGHSNTKSFGVTINIQFDSFLFKAPTLSVAVCWCLKKVKREAECDYRHRSRMEEKSLALLANLCLGWLSNQCSKPQCEVWASSWHGTCSAVGRWTPPGIVVTSRNLGLVVTVPVHLSVLQWGTLIKPEPTSHLANIPCIDLFLRDRCVPGWRIHALGQTLILDQPY